MTTMVQAVANTYRCPVCNHLTCQVNTINRSTDTKGGKLPKLPRYLKVVPGGKKIAADQVVHI